MKSDDECDRPRKRSTRDVPRFVGVAALALCLGVLGAGGIDSGCGSGQELLGPVSSEASTPTTASGSSSVTTASGTAASSATAATAATSAPSPTAVVAGPPSLSAIAQVFADIAKLTAPTPTYGLVELPAGISIPADWWPVLSTTAPGDHGGPVVSNPRITGEIPGAQEVQLVLRMSDGWLVVLENFRGDLGDVTGSPVGRVAGHIATLYALNGGVLVQWSDQGAWYGVFGRGVPSTDVVRIALGMTLVDPGH
ncbi:MAG: hypothetical protein V1912_13260 [bacterium]